jgi:hypothetical protein
MGHNGEKRAVASPQMLIADLRRWLARMESHGRASAAVLPFDIGEVDAHVPGGGLQLGHLHEVIEGGAVSEYAGLATLFAAGVVARPAGPVGAVISLHPHLRGSAFIPIGPSAHLR